MVCDIGGKTRPPAAFYLLKRGKPPSKRGASSSSIHLSSNAHTASPNAFTYARIQILQSTALFLLSAAAGMWPQFWPGERRGCPVRPGTPWLVLGRTAPWLWPWWPHPPLRPGAAGWASGISAGSPLPTSWIRGLRHSFGAPRSATSYISPLPGRPPSRGREPEAGPPPRQRRGPLGVESPRVSRSALSQATMRWPVRAPQGVRGPPICSHSRPTQAVSPSPSPWFSLAPRRSMPATVPRATPHG